MMTRSDNDKPLMLEVKENTIVKLNGKSAALTAIPEGTVVRAAFRTGVVLPVAVRIDAGVIPAEKPKTGVGGSEAEPQVKEQPQQQPGTGGAGEAGGATEGGGGGG
jgi:hypothetical protein